MPFLLAALALIGAAYFWIVRMRNAAEMTHELSNVASDVMAAARRFGFRRKQNQHPVEGVDDPNLATAALGLAFLELDGLPTADMQANLTRSLQSRLSLDHAAAQEALILGRWLLGQSGGPATGFDRVLRRLVRIGGKTAFMPLMQVLDDVAKAGSGLTDRQRDALEGVQKQFHL